MAVCAISFWEVAMQVGSQKSCFICPRESVADGLAASRLVEILIDGIITLLSCQLGNFHKDPADRFIVVTMFT